MDTERNAEFLEEIKKHLNPDRLYHSLNVADEAKKLAQHYGADEKKAFTAGLLHDIMKNKSQTELIAFFSEQNTPLTATERISPKTWHALAGTVYCERVLGVTDKEILTAIRYHTTGRAGMTLLENYDGVERMREKAYISLEYAMEEGLQFTIEELAHNGFAIHEDSVAAYNELIMNRKDDTNDTERIAR